jgi:hypothetical protein
MLSKYIHTYTKYNIMDKGEEILKSILLLQQMDTPKKIPMYHYALDYTLSAIFLFAYGFGIYALIKWLWV